MFRCRPPPRSRVRTRPHPARRSARVQTSTASESVAAPARPRASPAPMPARPRPSSRAGWSSSLPPTGPSTQHRPRGSPPAPRSLPPPRLTEVGLRSLSSTRPRGRTATSTHTQSGSTHAYISTPHAVRDCDSRRIHRSRLRLHHSDGNSSRHTRHDVGRQRTRVRKPDRRQGRRARQGRRQPGDGHRQPTTSRPAPSPPAASQQWVGSTQRQRSGSPDGQPDRRRRLRPVSPRATRSP